MDRLDSWLNGQVGWRRVALTWLVFCPMGVTFGSLTQASIALQHPGCEQLAGDRFIQKCEPRLGAGFLVVAALSVLAVVPFAVLLAVLQRRWARRNPGRPFLSWCRIAFVWCLSAAGLLSTFSDQQQYGSGTRQSLSLSAGLLLVAAAVFFLLEMRRRRSTRTDAPRH